MSDNRRVYRTIRMAIQQLYPRKLSGKGVRMLTTLAALVSGIVQGKSCQLPTIARKAPDHALAESRVKRYTRWIQNERVDYEGCYLPFGNNCWRIWPRSANWSLSSMAVRWDINGSP